MERLIKFNDNASFECPKCGNVISPSDFSNSNYLVESVLIDVTCRNLVIVIECKCSEIIFLTLPIPDISYVYGKKFVTRYEVLIVKETTKDGTKSLH